MGEIAFAFSIIVDPGSLPYRLLMLQAVTPSILQGLMELIRNEMSENGAGPAVESFYRSTLRHIQHQKAQGGEVGERYAALAV